MSNPKVTRVPGQPNLFLDALGAYDVANLGYVAEEFFVYGTATSYAATGSPGSDGHWQVEPESTADYTTRVVVLRPNAPAVSNGTAIVEWLNVTGGIDAPAEWFMAHREIVREGYAYVAVSAQRVGVEGGLSRGADRSLKTMDPERYSQLNHPGDAFSYDIYSQIGRLVRDGALGMPPVAWVLAAGESQSALYLTTYVNAVDPHAQVYDGFLVHSRFAIPGPLDGSSIFDGSASKLPVAPQFRSDSRVPLVAIITETDLMGGPRPAYYLARQLDNERLRVWEIPGTAHADNYMLLVGRIDTGAASIEQLAAAYAPTSTLMGMQLSQAINFAPQHHYVLQAGLAALHRWVRTGEAPPEGKLIELTNADQPQLVLDNAGLAKGGIRTPWVDVPVARTSEIGDPNNAMASMFGSGEMFDAATIASMYPGGATDYLGRFETSLDAVIGAGFLLPADREEILQLAAATYPGGN